MRPQSRHFRRLSRRARENATLQAALAKLQQDTRAGRRGITERLPEFEALRDSAAAIRAHALDNLAPLLERFEANAVAAGARVHWCETADDACRAVAEICATRGARTIAKGKSMVSEEIGLNAYLESRNIHPVETDLGEYILQLRDETPSHLVMPAIHLTRPRISETFREHHRDLDPERDLDDAASLTAEARGRLRNAFTAAEIGLTGANILVAETGSCVLVTNEGNGDLAHTMAPVHIILTSIEKVVPTFDDACTLLRVLARSATGQEITCYTTFLTGGRRDGDSDGPEEVHIILLDNGRSRLVGGPFHDILRCIKCGACQSACPVYGAIGGHAYGWVYGGPIGSVLSPALIGAAAAYHLPQASTLCGACQGVCPVRIPIPALLRRWREEAYRAGRGGVAMRVGLRAWRYAAARPRLYRGALNLLTPVLRAAHPLVRRISGARLPPPARRSFLAQWNRR